jgi:NAD(P)-dependent dehydrogenase (short-subunit alcohol dehydrogenase family)
LLAQQHRPRLVLLGQTLLSPEPEELSAATDEAGLIRLLARGTPAPPAEVTARARRILAAREIRDNLAAFERAGSPVRYVSVDVRDAGAVRRALDDVRHEWGPITGIVHGAGVLADARLGDKTDEQFARVYRTKVDGLRALLDATAGDPLDVLCAFSSVAAVFGNPGQADYAMANEVLHQVLAAERLARPDCLVRVIAWGPWSGGMVTPTLAERFRESGVPLIDPAAGARSFVAELTGQPGSANGVLCILTPPADAVPPTQGTPKWTADVIVNDQEYPYLTDHRVNGVCVVPVATVLDWFAGATEAWRPYGTGILLRDLRVLNKLTVASLADGGDRLTIDGREDGSALELTLSNRDGRAHYRVTADAMTPTPRQWTAPSGLEPHQDPYDGTTLFHGPSLRALRGAPCVGRDGAESVIGTSPSLGWPANKGRLDVAAVDGALQLAVLWGHRAGAGDTLPMAVDEIRLHGQGVVDDPTRCVVRAVSADGTGAVCDAALLDADGRPRVELIGIRLVRRPGG